jgi:hypothetical protein
MLFRPNGNPVRRKLAEEVKMEVRKERKDEKRAGVDVAGGKTSVSSLKKLLESDVANFWMFKRHKLLVAAALYIQRNIKLHVASYAHLIFYLFYCKHKQSIP